jgi:cytochrome c biogenesis protein CcmG/thiol:disulfide interchange protein DsbE
VENDSNPPTKKSSSGNTLIWVIVFIIAVATGVLFIVSGGGLKKAANLSLVGKPAPQFSFTSSDGKLWNNHALLGKVTVINFWASWCSHCQQEAKILQQTWVDLQAENRVIMIGISYEDTPADALAYLAKYGITYSNGVENVYELEKAFGVTGVPSTFLIGKDGIVVDFKLGSFVDETEFLEWVEKAF